jgi:orotidine-5'-phosphate decarboxylase
MTTDQLYAQVLAKKSLLCVGLDVDYNKLPEKILFECRRGDMALMGKLFSGKSRAIMAFNKAIMMQED